MTSLRYADFTPHHDAIGSLYLGDWKVLEKLFNQGDLNKLLDLSEMFCVYYSVFCTYYVQQILTDHGPPAFLHDLLPA